MGIIILAKLPQGSFLLSTIIRKVNIIRLLTFLIAMAFEHHPGLAALHQAITGEQNNAKENKEEIEAIAKEVEEDKRLRRPRKPVVEETEG